MDPKRVTDPMVCPDRIREFPLSSLSNPDGVFLDHQTYKKSGNPLDPKLGEVLHD